MRQRAEAWEVELAANAESCKRKPEPHEEDRRLESMLPSGEIVGGLFTMDEDEVEDDETCHNVWDDKEHGFDAEGIGKNDEDYQEELVAGR
eukprot:565730-Heterocapsa_arctica.AAC.1